MEKAFPVDPSSKLEVLDDIQPWLRVTKTERLRGFQDMKYVLQGLILELAFCLKMLCLSRKQASLLARLHKPD